MDSPHKGQVMKKRVSIHDVFIPTYMHNWEHNILTELYAQSYTTHESFSNVVFHPFNLLEYLKISETTIHLQPVSRPSPQPFSQPMQHWWSELEPVYYLPVQL